MCSGHIRYMHNQGIIRGPALGLIDAFNGLGVAGVTAQSINGFRGKGDQLTGADQFGGLAQAKVSGFYTGMHDNDSNYRKSFNNRGPRMIPRYHPTML